MHQPLHLEIPAGVDAPSLRRRAVSLVLALIAEILIILAFLMMNGPPGKRETARGPVLLDLAPEAEEAAPTAEPEKAPAREQVQQKPPPVEVTIPPVEHPPVPSKNPLPYFIPLTKDEYAAADIGKFPSKAAGPATGQASAGQGSAPGDSKRVGSAPNGEPMYAAEWYREPTDAELGAYLPKRMPPGGGWGLIACKTVNGYRVEDCVEIGNSPPGSHLAGAVRQAAWQFRVRPPRVGGKELVGTWVSIRIDYNREPAPQ